MKKLLALAAAIIGLSYPLHATEEALEIVPLPLDRIQDVPIVVDVPFIIGLHMPDAAFTAIGKPYIPPVVTYRPGTAEEDINVASRVGIKVEPHMNEDGSYLIKIDYAKVKPDDQTEDLLNLVIDCILKLEAKHCKKPVTVSLINLPEESALHAAAKKYVNDSRKPAEAPKKETSQLTPDISDQKPSVVISTKFVEVNTNTTEELGFDWIVDPKEAKSE